VFGGSAGRLWPDMQVLVPAGTPDEAFAVGFRSPKRIQDTLRWFRVDLARGDVVEQAQLSVRFQQASDIHPDGTQVAFVRKGKLRLRTSTDRLRWVRGGWARARFLGDGGSLLAVSAEGHLGELDTATGAERWRLKGHPPAALSPDRRVLAYLVDRAHMALHDLADGREVARWPVPLHDCVVLPDGIVVGVRYRWPEDPELVRLAPGQRRAVWTVPLGAPARQPMAAAGDRIFIPAGDGVQERLAVDGALLARHEIPAGTLRYAIGDGTGGVRAVGYRRSTFFDWTSRRGVRSLVEGHEGPVGAIAVAPSGTLVASRSAETVRVWDVATGRELAVLDAKVPFAPFTPPGIGSSLRFTVDGRHLLATDRHAPPRCWRVADFAPAPPPFPLDPATVAWRQSPGGDLLWTQVSRPRRDHTDIVLTRLTDGTVLWRTAPDSRGLDGMTFAGADALMVEEYHVGRVRYRTRVVRLTAATGYRPEPVPIDDAMRYPRHARFGPDGTIVALSDGLGGVRLYDALTGRPHGQYLLTGPDWTIPAFDDRGRLYTIDGQRSIGVRRPADLRRAAELALHDDADAPAVLATGAGVLFVGTCRGLLVRYPPD
jgi:hypothetical protein